MNRRRLGMTTLASAAAVALTLAAVPVATYVVPACTPFCASASLAGASDGGRSACWPRRANAVAGQRPTPTGSRLHTGMHMSERLGSSGYPDLAFDYESAAETGSDDVAPERRIAEMLQILRDEALPYLEEPMLRAQMQKHVLSRYSLAEVVASILAAKLASSDLSEAQLFETLLGVMRKRPQLSLNCVKDLEWCREVDPATVGFLQPLFYFKGTQAVLLQRICHQLWLSGGLLNPGKKMLALSLQSRGSEVLGVDAHPGAVLQYAVMLDHATGIVIGETGTIGHNCYILHGVTLGSTGKGDAFDRHPKIGNGVTIGAGATVLGNIKVASDVLIGAGAIVTVNVKEGDTVVGINRVLDASSKQANMNDSNKDTWLYMI